MGRIKEARKDAEALVRSLKEAGGLVPAGGGRPSGGVDRATSLALGEIRRGVRRIEGALEPSAADERSLL